MKIGAISGDLVVKLALGAGAIVAAVSLYKYIKHGLPSAAQVVTAVNPADPGNVVNSTVTAWGGAVNSSPDDPGKNADGSWTFGGWIYDKTHPPAFTPGLEPRAPFVGSIQP